MIALVVTFWILAVMTPGVGWAIDAKFYDYKMPERTVTIFISIAVVLWASGLALGILSAYLKW